MVDPSLHYVGGKLRPTLPPIYAEPGAMPDDVIATLSERARQFKSDPRKEAQHRRYLISRNQHEQLIVDSIHDLQKSSAVAKAISQHVSTTHNPCQDAIRDICTVYKRAVLRRVTGVSDASLKEFQKLAHESKIDALGPQLNRDAFFIGPQLVLPTIRRGNLRLEIVNPWLAEVVLDRFDLQGPPVAVSYSICDASDHGTGADLCIIDGQSRRYFRQPRAGDELVEIEDLREDHGLGYCPVAVLRFEVPTDAADWHDAFRHRRLEDGSIDVGRICAHRDLVRRTQNRILLTVAGDLSALQKGQNPSDPERPILLHFGKDKDVNAAIDISTLPFSQDPSHFQADIRDKVDAMARSTGVPHVVSQNGESWGVQWDWSALTELRQEQIAFCRAFEEDLWAVACDYARAMRRPNSELLPSADEVRSGLLLEFGQLSRSSADPREKRDQTDWELSKGLVSPIDLLREYHPNLSDEKLQKLHEQNIDESTKWYGEIAARNGVLDPAKMGMQSADQINGSMGTPAREANRQNLGNDDNRE